MIWNRKHLGPGGAKQTQSGARRGATGGHCAKQSQFAQVSHAARAKQSRFGSQCACKNLAAFAYAPSLPQGHPGRTPYGVTTNASNKANLNRPQISLSYVYERGYTKHGRLCRLSNKANRRRGGAANQARRGYEGCRRGG